MLKAYLKTGGVACLAACLLATTPALAKTFVYVSDAEDGVIDGYSMNMANGVLTPLGKTKAGTLVMPMTVSPNKRFLYAVVRSQPLRVVTYAIDPASGALTEKATAPLPDSMAYVSTDATGRFLFTASYGGDKIAVSPIEANGLATSEASQVIPTGKNAHSIRADRSNHFVYATNLGSSQILEYTFDAGSGTLTPNDPPMIKVKPDNGPRHIAISPDNRYLYTIGELSGNITQFAIDPKKGVLTELDYVGTIPADSGLMPGAAREAMAATATSGANTAIAGDDGRPKVWAADIQMTPNGKFVYATERTKSHIALLSVASKTGKLTYVTNFPTEAQPRGIRIDPEGKYLVAAGQKSDHIASYKIDPKTGKLSLIGRFPVGHDANWVEIVTLP
ncbi:6-phosphogluconolactonase [Azospirillum sp. TSO35-2]|nr:6-phosphogluconolactonase [Azospirillum sp. TSO35-2]